jgi:hypothetical protein
MFQVIMAYHGVLMAQQWPPSCFSVGYPSSILSGKIFSSHMYHRYIEFMRHHHNSKFQNFIANLSPTNFPNSSFIFRFVLHGTIFTSMGISSP